jgi:hypothetical protein
MFRATVCPSSGADAQNNTTNLGRVLAMPRLCQLYPGVCLTAEEKHGKTSVRVAEECQLGTMKTEYTEQNIHNDKYT